jgi:protocatechuate 3,4-dioxygenase beta subunit
MSQLPYSSLTRRRLLADGACWIGGLAVACSADEKAGDPDAALQSTRDGGRPDRPAAPDAGASPVPYGDPTVARDASTSPDLPCQPTLADIEGPFFTPESPERSMLADAGLTGDRLRLRGRALDGQCRPIAGAVLDFWQADVDGAYDTVGFMLRGHVRTDAEGRYEIETIVPGRYLNGAMYRPAHIHAKAYVNGRELLTTQLYFEDDPYNDVDPWFQAENALALRGEAATGFEADFDFNLDVA